MANIGHFYKYTFVFFIFMKKKVMHLGPFKKSFSSKKTQFLVECRIVENPITLYQYLPTVSDKK